MVLGTYIFACLDKWFPNLFLEFSQHCTIWISALPDTSQLGVSIKELMTWIKCLWLGCALLGRLQKEVYEPHSLKCEISYIDSIQIVQHLYIKSFKMYKCLWILWSSYNIENKGINIININAFFHWCGQNMY